MKTLNIERIIESCDTIQRRTCISDGCMHSSVRCFDACMRAFDCDLPAEAISFRIFINAPVMKYGEATIHRDGSMEMRTL